jgi:aspartyl-tRNA(Asn)/glutamyl-tRNA(Gln) amidotransferase subunit A
MTSPAEVHKRPLHVTAPSVRARELRSRDLLEACLREIEASNPALNAFITVMAEEARAAADRADREIAAGHYRGPLHGIPISLKDLIDVAGVPTTAASRVREGHTAAADATVVSRLRDAGAVLVGKTNLHEFAFGTTSDESAYGPARNPHDPRRSPGGSSGGSAAAVFTGMCLGSIGTDTGGSIRIPSAACGIVGLKATLGEIPCGGVVPLSRTLDHVGPMARTVLDVALMWEVMAGRGAGPAWEARIPPLRLAIPEPYFLERLDADVRLRFSEACDRLREAGHTIDRAPLAAAAFVPTVYLHIVLAEAAAIHAATLERAPERYVPAVRTRLEMGRYVLGEDYVRAMRGREEVARGVDAALTGVDALILPALAIPAPVLGASSVDVEGIQEPVRALTLRLTQAFNLSGHPALSIPMGLTPEGLPCGFQLVGRRGATRALLQAALACEGQVSPGPGSVGGGTG